MSHADRALAFLRRFFRLAGSNRDDAALAPLLASGFAWLGPDASARRDGGLPPAVGEGATPAAWLTALAEGRWTALPVGGDAWLLTGEAEVSPPDKDARRLTASCLCRTVDGLPKLQHVHLTALPLPGAPFGKPDDAARQRLRTIADNIPGGVHCCRNDEALTIDYMSDGFLHLLGRTRADVADRFHNSLVELMYEPDRAPTLAGIRAQLAQTGAAEVEYRVQDSLGRLKWVLGKGRLLREDGRDRLYWVILDTTELKTSQTRLQRTQARYRQALLATNLHVFECELPDDSFRLLAPARPCLFPTPPDRYSRAVAETAERCHPEDRERFLDMFEVPSMLAALARGEKNLALECRLRGPTDDYTWYSLTLALMPGENGPHRIIGCLNDIDERKRRESQMLLSAQTDGLTGLYNKTCTERLIRECLSARPDGEHAFLLVDIDNFKAVNDNLGHLFGDAVLADIAAKIRQLFRSTDILGRIGGDEFVVFLKNAGDGPALRGKLEKLVAAFRRSYAAGAHDYAISCSAGVALAPRDGNLYADLYRKADTALYMAKNSGKNRYCVYDEGEAARRRLSSPHNRVTEIADSGPSPKFRDNLLSYAFSMLYEARDIDAAVELILGMIGDHYGVSRAYVFENSADDLLCSNTHEWCAKGVAPQKDLLQNLAYADLGDFYKRCSTEGIYYCWDIDELEGTARELVKTQGIRSMLHVAIFDEHRPRGFVGFDECQGLRLWTQDEIDTLALLAKIVGIFVLKRNISARLAAAYHDIRAVLDSMAAWAYVIDENTHELLYLNEATRYFVPRARVGLKCYEAFFEGREEPCVHCPMLAMKQHDEQRATMEIENPSLDRWVEATASRIPWSGGNKAVLLCCTDITRFRRPDAAGN